MLLRFATAAATVFAPVVASAAGVQDFRLRNRTGYVISEVYVAPTKSNDWEEDVLGRDVLGNGDYVDIEFSPREDVCHYDLKVVFDDGDDAEWDYFNLCSVSKITIYYNNLTGETTAEYK